MKRMLTFAAAAVALAVAGCGGGNSSSSSSSSAASPPPAQTTPTTSSGGGASSNLQVAADPSGALKFDKSSLSAKSGNVKITMNNPSSVPHGIGVKGNGLDKDGAVVNKGSTSTVSVSLKPGTYEFYCPVPGHEQAGMKGTLTVK
jgi:uncharacterized cupredoxin-like copper-binding protein